MNQFIEFCKTISIIFTFIFIVLLILHAIYVFVLSILHCHTLRQYQKQEKFRNRLEHEFYLPISILLATYNDESSVIETIHSLLSVDYKLYEIIIIDDGSNDKTVQKVIQSFQLKKVIRPIRKQLVTSEVQEIYESNDEKIKITLLKKEHTGFADSFNVGINASLYPYFICFNTNFTLHKDALKNIVRPILEDDHVGICSGIVQVGKFVSNKKKIQLFQLPVGWFSQLQTLQYERFSFLSKSYENESLIPSFVLFRKDIVLSVLGFDKESVGENFEILRKIQEYCYVNHEKCLLKNAPHAISFTRVPNTLASFIKQQKRKNKSLFQSLSKYKKDLPWHYLFYTFYLPIIEVILFIVTILACIFNFVDSSSVGLLLLGYSLFCWYLVCAHFIFQLWTENIKIPILHFIKVSILGFFDVTVLQLIRLFTKIKIKF